MRETVLLASENALRLLDASTGAELGSAKDSFSSTNNGVAIIGSGGGLQDGGSGHIRHRGLAVCLDRVKPLIRIYALDKLDASLKRLTTPENGTCLTVSSDGGLIAVGSSSGAIRVWDLSSGALLRSFRAHQDTQAGVQLIKFSDDGTYLFVVLSTSVIMVYAVTDIVASIDGTGFKKHDMRRDINPLQIFDGHVNPITAVVFSSHNTTGFCVSADSSGLCLIWRLGMGKVLSGAIQFGGQVVALASKPQNPGIIVASVQRDGGTTIEFSVYQAVAKFDPAMPLFWDNWEPLINGGGEGCPTHLHFTAAGNILLSVDSTHLHFWNTETKQPLRRTPLPLKDPITAVRVVCEIPTVKMISRATQPVAPPETVPIPLIRNLEVSGEDCQTYRWVNQAGQRRLLDAITSLGTLDLDRNVEALWTNVLKTEAFQEILNKDHADYLLHLVQLKKGQSLMENIVQQVGLEADAGSADSEGETLPPSGSQTDENWNEIVKAITAVKQDEHPPLPPNLVAALEQQPSQYSTAPESWRREIL